jgi:hypothetical protein
LRAIVGNVSGHKAKDLAAAITALLKKQQKLAE